MNPAFLEGKPIKTNFNYEIDHENKMVKFYNSKNLLICFYIWQPKANNWRQEVMNFEGNTQPNFKDFDVCDMNFPRRNFSCYLVLEWNNAENNPEKRQWLKDNMGISEE